MSETPVFARELAELYVELGYAEQVDEGIIRSLDEDQNEIQFDVEFVDVVGSRQRDRELVIYLNGAEVFSEVYSLGRGNPGATRGEDEIMKDVMKIVLHALNV